jgi:hypothetical protein
MNSSSSITLTNSSSSSPSSSTSSLSSSVKDVSKFSHSDQVKTRYLIKLMQLSIKCFHHCSSTIRYLCFELPEKCPTCSLDLNVDNNTKFKVPPFIVPSPLVLANKNFHILPKFSLLLQPTDGNYSKFLYKNDSTDSDIGNLHIGITNSRSEIFDFDMNGLNRNLKRWLKPSIAIKLGHKLTLEQNRINLDLLLTFKSSDDDFFKSEKTNGINLYDKWDLLLEECWLKRKNQWSQSKYDENKFNCFDFVISFLIEYGYFDMTEEDSQDKKLKQLLSATKNNQPNLRLNGYLKEKMTNDMIESEFVKFLKYLNLLVKLRKQKFLIENVKVN